MVLSPQASFVALVSLLAGCYSMRPKAGSVVKIANEVREEININDTGGSEVWECLLESNKPGCPLDVPTFTKSIVNISLNASGFMQVPGSSTDTYEYRFYRNLAYTCGLTGHYTFLVLWLSPAQETDTMPLWVYEHGGGIGYWEEDEETYQSSVGQDEDSQNNEETVDVLLEQVSRTIFRHDGIVEPTTLTRRFAEGYRVMLPAYCDHDGYAGVGTPYPNNRNGGEVNGLQASWAAVDYTLTNFETSHYFLHGCSAGSLGVSSLSLAMVLDGYPRLPTGAIADSWVFTNRVHEFYNQVVRDENFRQTPDFNSFDLVRKVGWFAQTVEENTAPEYWLRTGFPVPMMWMYGELDPACGGQSPPLKGAIDTDTGNCEWLYQPMNRALNDTPGSPHRIAGISGGVHCPSVMQSNKIYDEVAVDTVDDFINSILDTV